MPSLQSLKVTGRVAGHHSMFSPWTSGSKLGKLQTLHLENLTFMAGSGNIDAWSSLNNLKHLSIRNCKQLRRFLEELDTQDWDTKSTKGGWNIMDCLSIYQPLAEAWVTAVDKLLSKIGSLTYLYVSTQSGEQLHLGSVVSYCGHQLRYFVGDFLNSWDEQLHWGGGKSHVYHAKSLTYLAEACTSIEELGLSLISIDSMTWASMSRFFGGTKMNATSRKDV